MSEQKAAATYTDPGTQQSYTVWILEESQQQVRVQFKLVDDCARISNRMTSLLKCHFPQVLEWFPNIRTTLVCEFLSRWHAWTPFTA